MTISISILSIKLTNKGIRGSIKLYRRERVDGKEYKKSKEKTGSYNQAKVVSV
jgi:hypothetical protein